MKFFLAVCLLAVVSTSHGRPSSSSSYGGYGYNPYPTSYGGQMTEGPAQYSKSASTNSYDNSYSVTYYAPEQTYTAQPVTYASPQITFYPPNVNYNGQQVIYSQPETYQSGGSTYGSGGASSSY